MCWLYGHLEDHDEATCLVCVRKRTAKSTAVEDVVTQKDPPLINTDQYASGVKLPEAARVSRNQNVRAVLFPNDAAHAARAKAKAKRVKKRDPRMVAFGTDSCLAMFGNKRRRVAQEASSKASVPVVVSTADVPLGVKRLFQFLAVLDMLGNAPWANVRFPENEAMLRKFTATHLILIVGREEYTKHRGTLLSIIDSVSDLSKLVHLTWITNRQQGKTTTLAKFLAAMAMISPMGGPLIYVYSTTRDRAVELVDGAKRYINWILNNKENVDLLTSWGLQVKTYTANNTIGFALPSFIDNRIINNIKARPKTADSCRGDAPRACMFDEVAFVSADFWFKFAYPLIQVGERVFVMATTPAHNGTFFAAFTDAIIAAEKAGNTNFTLTNHSVICEECLEAGLGAECCHKLNMIPKWKSVLGFNAMKDLVPAKRMADFQKEVYGVIKAEGNFYLPAKHVNKVFCVERMKPFVDMPRKITLYFSIDPPSHGVSYFGGAGIVYNSTGSVFLVGTCEVTIQESEMIQLKAVIGRFVVRIIEKLVGSNRKYGDIRVVPIVECNNNQFQSNDIVETISSTSKSMGCVYKMPFTREFFTKSISEHIGVWTTSIEKLGGLQSLLTLMQDNRIIIWNKCVTIGAVYTKRSREVKIEEALETLRCSLREFKETSRGPSGKSANTNDDAAMALIMAVYWSFAIRATEMFR